MKIKTPELTGIALDWAVAKCERDTGSDWTAHTGHKFSTDWRFGGPILDRERINIVYDDFLGQWKTLVLARDMPLMLGDTPLIAAMRCYVASKLGDGVELPSELTNLILS